MTLAAGSRISASGAAGGGTVAIGTTLARAKGGPGTASALTASTVRWPPGASIAANATASGNGGRVTVLSSKSTAMAGEISAMGGPHGGNGGFVEVSGDVLTLTGLVNATAPLGKTGTLLLDPTDLWISDTSPPNAQPGFSWVSPATLEAEDADITLSATGDLFVATTNGTTNTLNLVNVSLSLTAGNNLTIDRGFAITAFTMSLTATSGAITLGGSSGVTGGLITANQLSALGPTSLQVGAGDGGDGDVVMSAGTGIALADSTLGSADIPIRTLDLSTTSGPVTQSAAGVIMAQDLTSSGGLNGNVSLIGTGNQIGEAGDLIDSGGDITLVDNSSLVLSGSITGNNLFFEVNAADGSLELGAQFQDFLPVAQLTAATGGRISLVADNITEVGDSQITVDGGIVELAPHSAINVSLLGTIGLSPGLVIDAELLDLIDTAGTGKLVVGGYTNVPAGATLPAPSASSVTLDNPLDLTGVETTLGLFATGAVTEGSNTYTVDTLTGNAGTVTLDNIGNNITTLGSFAANVGAFTLADGGNTVTMTVTGPVTSPADITLSNGGTGAITATGNIGAGTASTLSITSGSGGITLAGNADLTGGTVNLDSGPGGISLTGNSVVGQANGVVDLTASAAGVTEFDSSTIIAATLQGNVAGPVTLGNDNTVLTVGSFSVGGGSSTYTFTLRDTGTLAVTGPLTATGDVNLNVIGTGSGDAITITGSIGAGGTLTAGSGLGNLALDTGAVLTAPTISLFSNGITFTGNASVGGVGSVVNLESFGGPITEASTSTITAATLESTPFGSEGSVSLLGTNNAIGALGAFSVFGSSFDGFTLVDSIPLTVTGPVNANNPPFNSQNVVLEDSGSIIVNGSITASGDIILATGGAGPTSPPPATANPLISVPDATITSTGGSVSLLAGVGGTVQLGANLDVGSTSGTLVAGSGQLVTLQTDALSVFGASKITAPSGTIEVAPATQGNTIDFATAGDNILTIGGSEITAMSAGALRLGAVTINGTQTTTAGAIDFDTAVDLTGHVTTLLLLASGPISETGGPLTVNTLTATGTSIDLPTPTTRSARPRT